MSVPGRRRAPLHQRGLRFTTEDLERFAAASGDRNPLHLDPAFARRTPFGRPVVHGALGVIALLGCIPAQELAAMRSVEASFGGPLLPDSDVEAAVGRDERRADGWWGTLSARGKEVLRLTAWPGADAPPDEGPVDVGAGPPTMRETPADVDVEAVAVGDERTMAYAASPELVQVAGRWDAAAVDPALLEGIAWCSYVVGMEVPGLRSLLAGLRVARAGAGMAGGGRGHVRVTRVDPRTGRILLDGVLGGASGPTALAGIEAFGRPRPASQAPLAASPGDPARGAVVVVGGSRGFGAALTLALLAAGYAVHLLYAVSTDAAEETRAAAGDQAGRLTLHRVDARDVAALEAVAGAVRAAGRPLQGIVLNAATPPLGMRVTSASAGDLADYVRDAVSLAAVPLGALLPLLDETDGWVTFSSTAALAAPPLDWPHYVTAKGALEALAGWTAAARPAARVIALRAPKMRTDFTASPSGAIGAVGADDVARWLVRRLTDDALPTGLTVLDPPEDLA